MHKFKTENYMEDSKFNNDQVQEVSNVLQDYMRENCIEKMSADECADILLSKGVLEQVPPQPGFNFRQMLRDGRDGKINMVDGAHQFENSRWVIRYKKA